MSRLMLMHCVCTWEVEGDFIDIDLGAVVDFGVLR